MAERRIDFFAAHAMVALLTREKADFHLMSARKKTKKPRDVIIAKQAYKIAAAMEAEALKHT